MLMQYSQERQIQQNIEQNYITNDQYNSNKLSNEQMEQLDKMMENPEFRDLVEDILKNKN